MREETRSLDVDSQQWLSFLLRGVMKIPIIQKKYLINLWHSTFFLPVIGIVMLISSLGVSALVYQHVKDRPFVEPKANQNGPAAPMPPPIDSDSVTTVPITAPTATTSPVSTKSIPKPPDNTAQCNNLIIQKKTDLDSLNSQMQAQLAIMKTISTNQGGQVQQEINSTGSPTQQMINQSETAGTFNQASDTFDKLSSQYSTDQENYDNQLIGLSCIGWSP